MILRTHNSSFALRSFSSQWFIDAMMEALDYASWFERMVEEAGRGKAYGNGDGDDDEYGDGGKEEEEKG